jgi:ATP-dependent Clp protease ATP-binding subunit ClpC
LPASRPAGVASRVRINPDGTQETEYLCELDLAEERMSRGFGRSSLFDVFFSDFFGDGPSGGRLTPPAQQRQVERVDVTQFFSDATRELLQRAAQKGARTDVAPSLSPDAKAALVAAYEESRDLGSSYVGPEHVLLALARDTETAAGDLLERFGVSHTKLRGAVIRGVEAGGAPRETSKTPKLDEFGRDLNAEAREGKLDDNLRFDFQSGAAQELVEEAEQPAGAPA